eukprot:TRINITY_DN498_c0_g2_i1.p1 TRINITY_DN498_c0_g2~~TRINITY_DN498_c0_g2_i1.p1  ORF type:complete len:138 (-),score=32.77 TRINITY_DN498_c0_g2_i1:16-429(-)
MAPDWEKLSGEYAGSSLIIGDVDCTVEQSLCQKYGVSGYPTLKYFVQGEKNDYQGGRDFAALKQFAEENLAKACDVTSRSDCSDKELKFLDTVKAKPETVKSQLERLRNMQGAKVAPTLKQWINQRLNILTQLEKEL